MIAAAIALVVAGFETSFLPRRRESDVDEVKFFRAVAAELRVGASLRTAIADAAAGEPGLVPVSHGATSGSPFATVAAELENLPVNGRRAAAALRVAAAAGGRSAEVFMRLSDRAAAEADLYRQQRVLTAQVRLSALIVGGLPIASLAFGGGSRIQDLIAAGPGGALIAAVGVGMELAGVVTVWRLAVRR